MDISQGTQVVSTVVNNTNLSTEANVPTPRYGQYLMPYYLTHAHSHIAPVVAAMDGCRGRTAVCGSQPTATTCLRWSWGLKECFALALAVKGLWERRSLSLQRSDGFAMHMSCYVYFSAYPPPLYHIFFFVL